MSSAACRSYLGGQQGCSDSCPSLSSRSFHTDYCSTCPVPRQELVQSAKDALARQYGGETSPLDGAPFAEHTFVIPDVPGRFDRIRDQMAHLGLIPWGMTPSSLLNVFPLATHRHFEGHYMTFYPSLDTIQQCIDAELRHLLHREQETACGKVDPGRLRCSSTYASLPTNTPFDAFFDLDYGSDTLVNFRNRSMHATYRTSSNQYLPSLPSIDLAVSPTIMIWMRTSVLAGIHPRTPKIDELLELGMYLMRLWFATPQTFRDLDRPISLEPLPPPISPLQPQPGLASPIFSHEVPVISKNPFSEHLPFHNLPVLVPEEGGGICRRFSSNEWSLLRYGVFLGGAAWDCDEAGRELVGHADGPFAM